jgi:hypothetical protein
MSDIRRTIETIRGCLHSPDLTLSPQLREAAELYAESCRQLNERLGRCESSLRQGLRTEAIRQAEIDPDVMELAAELDFEGRDLWEERLIMNEADTPPPINRKAVELLNRAYAEEAPLAELLKHHRLLALARAPLRERVETVRLLARAEPANSTWAEDVATFEGARMDEMRADLRQIRQANDWPRIQAIKAEVAGEWNSPMPLDLIGDVDKEHNRLMRMDAQRKLTTHVQFLTQASAEFDLDRCHQIRALVEQVCRERNIGPNDSLMDPVRPLLDWVTEQDRLMKETRRFEKACADLMDSIGKKAETEAVISLYQAVADFRRPIPEEVERAYRDRLRKSKSKARLTLILFIIAMLGMLALFGGIIIAVVVLGR